MAIVKGMNNCEKYQIYFRIQDDVLTKNRLDFGCTSRKTSEKAAASPIQRVMSPTIRRTKADTGVKFPNALERRKRGKASCSIARKQYSF